ncbi:hypothetical protein LJB83_03130, partial [Clostridia bacterium OttesenSCG-928-F22]|nr:hypothetical protein [Clostridia bacterium OttesenSCG-928-F22]
MFGCGNGCGCDSCTLMILLCVLCGGFGNSCGCNDGCGNARSGFGNDCIWPILLLMCCGGCGNGCGCND